MRAPKQVPLAQEEVLFNTHKNQEKITGTSNNKGKFQIQLEGRNSYAQCR
jgi:hypothetical protein